MYSKGYFRKKRLNNHTVFSFFFLGKRFIPRIHIIFISTMFRYPARYSRAVSGLVVRTKCVYARPMVWGQGGTQAC